MKAANGTARPCSQLGGFLKQEAPTDSDDRGLHRGFGVTAKASVWIIFAMSCILPGLCGC